MKNKASKYQEEKGKKGIDEREKVEEIKIDFDTIFCKKLPQTKYSKNKYPLIPFDHRQSHDNQFDTLLEAIMFIIKHCKQHFQPSDKTFVRRYLQLCRILDIKVCDYIIPYNLTNKQYESAYRLAMKELKALHEI